MVVSVFLFVGPFSLFKWARRHRPDIISTKLNGLQHLPIHMTYSFLKNFGHEFCWITLRAVLIIGRVYEKTCCPAALVFLSLVVSGNSQAPNTARAKHYALYAPRPEYPLAARKQHFDGGWCFRVQSSCRWNRRIGRGTSKHGSLNIGSGSDCSISAVEIPPRRYESY